MVSFSINLYDYLLNFGHQFLQADSKYYQYPQHSLSNIFRNHHLLSPKPTHSALSTQTTLTSQESQVHRLLSSLRIHYLSLSFIWNPPLTTRVSHFVLGPLVSINALFLMWKKYILTSHFIKCITQVEFQSGVFISNGG